jgi:hypothetical protein
MRLKKDKITLIMGHRYQTEEHQLPISASADFWILNNVSNIILSQKEINKKKN